jgi:hypothetical protein
MLKVTFTFIFLFAGTISFSQINLKRVDPLNLPTDIQNISDISMALRWTDSLGDNVLVVTKKIIKREDEDRVIYKGRKGIINFPKNSIKKEGPYRILNEQNRVTVKQTIPSITFLFKIVNDSAILNWKVVGIPKKCEGEDGNHTKNWFSVTDLDNNFKSEIWLISRSECIEDPNKGTMQIVMYQDIFRYTMEGSILNSSPLENNMDNNFRSTPEVFRKYALNLWQQYVFKN